MPYTIVTAVHILACFFLVLVVLLQTGKGADVGAVFGGSSQTIFGSSGAGNFLTKTTTGIAILFMVTSLVLSYGAARRETESLFDDVPVESSPVQEESGIDTPGAGTDTATQDQGATDQPDTTTPVETSSPATATSPQSEASAESNQASSTTVSDTPAAPTSPAAPESAPQPTDAAEVADPLAQAESSPSE